MRPTATGRIVEIPEVNGLHHRYGRAAAQSRLGILITATPLQGAADAVRLQAVGDSRPARWSDLGGPASAIDTDFTWTEPSVTPRIELLVGTPH